MLKLYQKRVNLSTNTVHNVTNTMAYKSSWAPFLGQKRRKKGRFRPRKAEEKRRIMWTRNLSSHFPLFSAPNRSILG